MPFLNRADLRGYCLHNLLHRSHRHWTGFLVFIKFCQAISETQLKRDPSCFCKAISQQKAYIKTVAHKLIWQFFLKKIKKIQPPSHFSGDTNIFSTLWKTFLEPIIILWYYCSGRSICLSPYQPCLVLLQFNNFHLCF